MIAELQLRTEALDKAVIIYTSNRLILSEYLKGTEGHMNQWNILFIASVFSENPFVILALEESRIMAILQFCRDQ